MQAVPPNDLLRGLHDLVIRDGRSQERLMADTGYGESTLRRWWVRSPQSLQMLSDLADTLGYRIMFVSHQHPLTAVRRPVIEDPSK